MKKLFTLMTAACFALGVMATDYNGRLMVVLNGTALPSQDATISVNEDNGKYTLSLKNFMLMQPEGAMPIGNITLEGIEATQEDGVITLDVKQDIRIAPGDDESIPMWYGPILSAEAPIPVSVMANMLDDVLNAEIEIPFGEMNISVYFDSRQFQLPNSGFEEFHTATAGKATSDEPNNWHSFMSCTGPFAGIVSSVPHTFISEDVRPGSAGAKSVLVKSGKVLGFVVANGTITTGQLSAAAMSATDPKNNAFIDLTNEAKDANGDPFYTRLVSLPDSVSLWVKFKQGEAVPEHPYATMTAVITDGSYYQEPVDKDYNDIIVAKAAYATIESTGEWQEIKVPFDYASYTEKMPKAILVTISTNADPGQGTGNDELYVDDMKLVYSSRLSDIQVNGATIPGFDKDKYAYEYIFAPGTMPTIEEIAGNIIYQEDGKETITAMNIDAQQNAVTILAISADLSETHAYTVTFKEIATGIEKIPNRNDKVQAVYNLNGQKVDTMKAGQVYITKYADGKTVKNIKK